MNLEKELNEALQRIDPPEGFAERVLSRARTERARKHETPWGRVAAAGLLVAILAGVYVETQILKQRREGARARDEVLLALSVASEKINVAKQKVEAD